MPKGPVETPITDQEIAFAHLVLAGKLTDREAAEEVGISPGQAAYIKGKPRVKEYMASHRASVTAAVVEHESAVLVELNIGRETIMARYWELSQLPTTSTNGNISGQVKALDSLREMLGLLGPEEGTQTPARGPDVYRAKWLREAEEQEAEDEASGGRGSDRPAPAAEPRPVDRPAPAATPRIVQPVAVARPQVVEAPEPFHGRTGVNFGRFQGL